MTQRSQAWTDAEIAVIRAGLDKALTCRCFAQAERQQRFLKYVVNETLAGHDDRLKGYSIGVEVFDRPPDFDPAIDAIVRVEAGRLRAKLREYYAGEGRSDPVHIDLPKGAYAPVIQLRAATTTEIPSTPLPKMRSAAQGDSADAESHAEKPSIAVLPFASMSSDPEQEYFADGMTEDLITDLSQISDLFVIARHSAFAYKGAAKRVQDIGQELGVRYLLEGSVRRSAERVRITAQLIDARSGEHLWSQRYDRNLQEIFAVQDEVTRHIVSALRLRLTSDENSQLAKVGTDSIEAYELCRRGNAAYVLWTPDALSIAKGFYERAIAIDPTYAEPYARLARVLNYRWTSGMEARREHSLDLALTLARKAVELDPDLPLAQGMLSWVCTWSGLHEEGVAAARRAVALDPGGAETYYWLGVSLSRYGETEEAEAAFARSMRLNPHHPVYYAWARAENYMFMHRYQDAIDLAMQVIGKTPTFIGGYIVTTASYAHADRTEEAQRMGRELQRLFPHYVLHASRTGIGYTKEQVDLYERGWELAGLPPAPAARRAAQ